MSALGDFGESDTTPPLPELLRHTAPETPIKSPRAAKRHPLYNVPGGFRDALQRDLHRFLDEFHTVEPASEAERQWEIKTCPKGEVVETTYMVVVFKKKEKKITLTLYELIPFFQSDKKFSTCFEPLAEHGWSQGWLGLVLRRRLLGFAAGIGRWKWDPC